MINNIKILIDNYGKKEEYFINCVENFMYINGLMKKIDIDIINDLLRFFITWNNENMVSNIIDGEEASIEIDDGNEIKNFYWKGRYPENYSDFKLFLRRLV